ncbi:hypothetical protein APSETT445_005631 [Aspergillus pseudonomiae]
MVNRACIYERHLPGDAYVTAHVQRLQHGFYSSAAVSDQDLDHVDFLGINFVFHSPNTLTHRFKAATIRASLHSMRENSKTPTASQNLHAYRSRNPRFLKHAPHLLYGAVSPETLQWNYSLAGSLGVAELPLMASISPSGGMNGRYRRYEMMRIQGSVPLDGGIAQDDNEIRREVTRDFTMVEPVRGIPRVPYTGTTPAGAAGKMPGNRNGVSNMLPILDPGSLSVRILLDNSHGHSSQLATHISALRSTSNIAKERDKTQGQAHPATSRDNRSSTQPKKVRITQSVSDNQITKRGRGT